MEREAAERERNRLQAEHPDRAHNTWIVRDAGEGNYEVMRVPLPPGMKRDPLKTAVESKPSPRDAEDPRQGPLRDIPPYGAI